MPLIRPLIRIRRPSPDKQPLIQLYPDSAKELYVFLLMGCDQEEAVPAVFQNIADHLQFKGLIKPSKGFIPPLKVDTGRVRHSLGSKQVMA